MTRSFEKNLLGRQGRLIERAAKQSKYFMIECSQEDDNPLPYAIIIEPSGIYNKAIFMGGTSNGLEVGGTHLNEEDVRKLMDTLHEVLAWVKKNP